LPTAKKRAPTSTSSPQPRAASKTTTPTPTPAAKKTAAGAKKKQQPKKVAKTSTKAGTGLKKKTRRRKKKMTFSLYIHRILKTLVEATRRRSGLRGADEKKRVTISTMSMAVMNSFVFDIFERIATEAGLLARKRKRKTLHSRDIQVAVRIILSGELAKHAIVQGMTAVSKFYPVSNNSNHD
ncbi:hypothetical protein SAMD00019534_013030, partial [Acytostelium subglobosum LB1]|uniref:hypothetical protein n=1 Tax=Acytostelium subglobosum LB1 TaxID=1410327 RepID=UPI000644C24B